MTGSILTDTVEHATPVQLDAVLAYVAAVLAGKITPAAHMPPGLHLWVRTP